MGKRNLFCRTKSGIKAKVLGKIILEFIFVLLISNCSPNPSFEIVPTRGALLPATASALVQNSASTNVVATQEPISTASAQIDSKFSTECFTQITSQNLKGIHETIVLFGEDHHLALLYPDSDQTKFLGRVVIPSVSSNKQALAYIDEDLHQLIVVSPSGKTLASTPTPDQWIEVLGWIGGEKVLIGNMPFTSNYGWKPPSSTIVYDLSNGKYSELLPNYPNIYSYISGPPNFGQYSYSLTVYSPTLTHVVYPSSNLTSESIILRDIPGQREVARLEASYPWNIPVWEPNGNSFIISVPPRYTNFQGKIDYNIRDNQPYKGGNDLFEVSKDGKVKRLTLLSAKYEAQQRLYTWSPDLKSIAFWLKTSESSKWELATLNIKTGEVTNYCIDGGPDPSYEIC